MIKLKRVIYCICEKGYQKQTKISKNKNSKGSLFVELIFFLLIGALGSIILFDIFFSFLNVGIRMEKFFKEFLSEIDSMNFVINEIETRGVQFPTLIKRHDRSYFVFITKVDGKEKVIGYYEYKDSYGNNHLKRLSSSDERLKDMISKNERVSESFLRKKIDGWNTIYEGKEEIGFKFDRDVFIIQIGDLYRSCAF